MSLFKIYPKSIETIKQFQKKLLGNIFYDTDPKNGIFTHRETQKIFVCTVSEYNVSECYILTNEEELIDYFVVSGFTNYNYKQKTLKERIHEEV